jgi:hypothetical protein
MASLVASPSSAVALANVGVALLLPRLLSSGCAAVQIEMGSTNIRVGSTIFGARDYSKKA